MAEIDKQKEWINFYKTLFFVLLGALFGVIGYVFTYIENLSEIKLILLFISGVILIVVNILVLKKLKKEIDKLEEM